jgi:hypothetical protein
MLDGAEKNLLIARVNTLVSKPGVSVEEWLGSVTPPDVSPGTTLICTGEGCRGKENLFMGVNDKPYCPACWLAYKQCDRCITVRFRSIQDVMSHFRGRKHNARLAHE